MGGVRHVYLTSYQLSHALPDGVLRCQCTVYPPKGYEHYPKVDWTDIRQGDGSWIRPRVFMDQFDPPKAYHDALMKLYESRIIEATSWAVNLQSDVALCCWCPYDRAAQRQLHEHGSFICHTEVLGEFLENRIGLRVWRDADRAKMLSLS